MSNEDLVIGCSGKPGLGDRHRRSSGMKGLIQNPNFCCRYRYSFPQLYRHVEQVAKSPLRRGVARWRSRPFAKGRLPSALTPSARTPMKLRLEARVSSDSPDAVGCFLVGKFGATLVTRDGNDWFVRAAVDSASARDANRIAERASAASGRPGFAQNGRRVTRSSDSSTTFPRAHDRPVGNIEPHRWVDAIRRKSAAAVGQPAMPMGRERDGPGRSHSCSFDQRRRPETLRTAMATAFFCPTRTTSRLPRLTPV